MNQRTLEPSKAEQTALAGLIKFVNWTPFIALSILGILIFAYWENGRPKNPETLGQLGDYIGGLLNPLVAGFALMALVVSIRLQKAELAATREELKTSHEAIKEQATTAEQQRREQRFFDLLNLYQETLKTFVIEGATGKAALNNWGKFSPTAQDCVYFCDRGLGSFSIYIEIPGPSFDSGFSLSKPSKYVSLTKKTITLSWNTFSPQLDHYFRTIFSILRELEKLLGDDHWRYAKLFRAQLSRDELTLLAFNLLFDEEGQKMRPLVAKYGLLKHLAKNKLRDYAITELDPKSFGLGWIELQKAATPREKTPC